MLFIRSLIFNIIYFTVLAVLCVGFTWSLLLPYRYSFSIARFVFSVTAWIEKYIGGISYRVVGVEHVPEGCAIIASKHQSAWETFKLHHLFHDPAIVLKKELLSIPVWGWYMARSGMIPIDRSTRATSLNAMRRAALRAKDEGRKIVIFVQGTRIKPLEQRPYKSGAVALYQELNVPVVPMALNSGLFWPKNSFIKKPGVITVEFLPPIPPGLSREAMMSRLKEGLEAASDKLAREPPSL